MLEDLDNELLEGVKDLPGQKTPPRKPSGKPSAGDDAAGDAASGAEGDRPDADAPAAGSADEEMTDAATDSGEEPLIHIGQQMRKVEKLIDREDQAETAERMQDGILSDLAKLIKQIEEQSQSQSSSSSKCQNPQDQPSSREQVKQPKPSSGNSGSQASQKPARESTDRVGKNDVQKPDADAVKGLLKDAWGQLPPHAREQMLQSPPEQFLPKYELLIEKYYKRLADQQSPKP